MKNSWNAITYGQFLELRTRPARDLLFAVPESFQPEIIYDLGCGPGNSTILLKDRWPHAKVVGFDSSSDMLNEARRSYPDIDFIEGDIAHFCPPEKIDLLFANASLQWLDEHDILIPKLLQYMNINGMLGIQMPNNFHLPSHQVAFSILQSRTDWQPLLKNLRYGKLNEPFYTLSSYYDLLTKSGVSALQLWETEYFQEMSDHQAIFKWIEGTGLQSVLSNMAYEDKTQFINAYIKAISSAYPLQSNNKILFPFKRIFMIGILASY